MRTTPALFLAAVMVVSACSAGATQAPTTAPTSTPTATPTATPTSTPTAEPTEEATPAPAPPTADELVSGIRSDLKGLCAPVKTALPASAIAGIECKPKSSVVSRVTLYLFGTQQDLLDTYTSRLGAHNVPMRTAEGRCLTGKASEGAYVPEGPSYVPERNGCYIDASGKAHYVATRPPFVLMEVDGKVRDIAAVERWAWLGNLDQPGGPTVWRSLDD